MQECYHAYSVVLHFLFERSIYLQEGLIKSSCVQSIGYQRLRSLEYILVIRSQSNLPSCVHFLFWAKYKSAQKSETFLYSQAFVMNGQCPLPEIPKTPQIDILIPFIPFFVFPSDNVQFTSANRSTTRKSLSLTIKQQPSNQVNFLWAILSKLGG